MARTLQSAAVRPAPLSASALCLKLNALGCTAWRGWRGPGPPARRRPGSGRLERGPGAAGTMSMLCIEGQQRPGLTPSCLRSSSPFPVPNRLAGGAQLVRRLRRAERGARDRHRPGRGRLPRAAGRARTPLRRHAARPGRRRPPPQLSACDPGPRLRRSSTALRRASDILELRGITQNLLILFPFTSARAQALETVIESAVATVAREQVRAHPTPPGGPRGVCIHTSTLMWWSFWVHLLRRPPIGFGSWANVRAINVQTWQHALVVRVCGLAPVLEAIDRNAKASVRRPRRLHLRTQRAKVVTHALFTLVSSPPKTPQPLARVPGMDARTLSISLDAFHAQLFTLTYESFLPAGVLSSRLGRRAAQLAVELFVGSYQYVCTWRGLRGGRGTKGGAG